MTELLLVFAAGFLLAFILFSRLIWKSFPVQKNFDQTEDGFWFPSWHNLATYDMSPHVGFVCAADWTEPVHNGGTVTRCRSNRLGFWMDHEVVPGRRYPKPSNEKTIVLTGGSAAMGWGASGQEHIMPAVLESLLNRDGAACRVFNFAMGGWIAFQELIALQLYGQMYDPDLIVIFDGRNDIVTATRHREDLTHPFNYAKGKLAYDFVRGMIHEPPPAGMLAFLNRLPRRIRTNPAFRYGINAALLPFVNKSTRLKKTFIRYMNLNRSAARPYDSSLKTCVGAADFYLHSMETILNSFARTRIVGFIQPSSVWSGQNESLALDRIRSGLENQRKSHPLFEFHDFSAEWSEEYFIDDCHMNDAGQRRFAAKIAAAIAGALSAVDISRRDPPSFPASGEPEDAARPGAFESSGASELDPADLADRRHSLIYPLY